MHASAESADAVIVVCGSGRESQNAAVEHIAAVDAASEGVPMRQVLSRPSHTTTLASPTALFSFFCCRSSVTATQRSSAALVEAAMKFHFGNQSMLARLQIQLCLNLRVYLTAGRSLPLEAQSNK